MQRSFSTSLSFGGHRDVSTDARLEISIQTSLTWDIIERGGLHFVSGREKKKKKTAVGKMAKLCTVRLQILLLASSIEAWD